MSTTSSGVQLKVISKPAVSSLTGHFIFDYFLGVPILVDTGATVSICPRSFYPETSSSDRVLVSFTGDCNPSRGTVERVLDLGMDFCVTHTFTVADVNLPFLIVGFDFLTKQQIGFDGEKESYVHFPSGQFITTIGGSTNLEIIEELTTAFKDARKITCNHNSTQADGINDDVDFEREEMLFLHSPLNLVGVSNSSEQGMCNELLDTFPMLFVKPDYNLPVKHNFKLDIKLVDETPILFRPRRCSTVEKEAIKLNFADLEKRGAVIKGSTKYTSPVTIVPKKKPGEYRFCVDYVKLNSQTQNETHPLPRIDGLTTIITRKHRYFSTLDLKEAYYSLPLTERASQFAGIVTMDGIYLPKRMPFGLKGAPSTFCEMIASVIKGLEGYVFAYLDDFLVFSENFQDHLMHLKCLLTRLDEFGLYLNREKCVFAKNKITFLGLVVSSEGISPIDKKIFDICQIERPQTLSQLRRFLGTINYYRGHVKNMAATISPLTALLKGPKEKKRSRLNWTEFCDKAYKEALSALKEAATLTNDNLYLPVILTTDASLTHAGAVLEQTCDIKCPDGKLGTRPLCFYSKAFPVSRSRDRSVFNRELTAAYMAIRHFKYRIRGRPLILRTDHSALVHAIQRGVGNHSAVENRMISHIKEYNPEVIHLAGENNAVADLLSRPQSRERREGKVSSSTQTENNPIVNFVSVQDDGDSSKEYELLSREIIAQSQVNNATEISKIVDENGLKTVIIDQDTQHGSFTLLCVDDDDSTHVRPILPTDLRPLAFRALHNIIHQGKKKSVYLISSFYFWPGLENDVKEWVLCCPVCQKVKVHKHNRQKLQSFPRDIPRLRFIHVDITGPLTESCGFRYVLSMKDRASGFLLAIPLKDRSSQGVVDSIKYHFIASFGLPNIIVTDRGGEFLSNIFREFCVTTGIHHQTTCAYNPASNGLVERAHRVLNVALRSLRDSCTWVKHLPFVTLMINNQPSDNNIYTPFQHVFGQPSNLLGAQVYPALTTEDSETTEENEDLTTAILSFCDSMRFYSRTARPLPSITPQLESDLFSCTHVLVRDDAVKPKLAPRYRGPYPVIERNEKYFKIAMEGCDDNVCINRLKVFHQLPQPVEAVSFPIYDDSDIETLDELGPHQLFVNDKDEMHNESDATSTTQRPTRKRNIPIHLRDYQLY